MASRLAKQAVTLVGAGTQGRRLAYMWSTRGRPVYLVDQNKDQLSRAWNDIQCLRRSDEHAAINKNVDRWGSIHATPAEKMSSALRDSWLVVECVPESLHLKKSVISHIDGAAHADTIVASNSSSYTITEILQGLDLKHRDRFVSLHSYWPPETPAIEIMPSPETRPDIVSRLMSETKEHGFEPFHVRKTSTGYIYNRIWAAIKREALMVVEEGVASPEEVDAIYRSVLKTPKGPCEQMDVVGLDVVLAIENHYAEVRSGLPEGPRKLLQRMIAEGKLGVKNGQGFYSYNGNN
ncbi:hypothetical protein VTN49DRAFT_5537 [Thermomyces lanuginosus]|uniref:uncharacterized protein n=1 Tax=Thermomyces lanuginosus TaxID=5541 RepID=UPI003744158A